MHTNIHMYVHMYIHKWSILQFVVCMYVRICVCAIVIIVHCSHIHTSYVLGREGIIINFFSYTYIHTYILYYLVLLVFIIQFYISVRLISHWSAVI